MKIIAFIEAGGGRQGDVIRKILEHCGLWNPPQPRPPPRPPPSPPPRAVRSHPASGISPEIDPDFLEHLRREQQADQLQMPWD